MLQPTKPKIKKETHYPKNKIKEKEQKPTFELWIKIQILLICEPQKRGQPKNSGEEDSGGEQQDQETSDPNEPPNPTTAAPKATVPTPPCLRILVQRLGPHPGRHRLAFLGLSHGHHCNAAFSSGSRSIPQSLYWVGLKCIHSGFFCEKPKEKDGKKERACFGACACDFFFQIFKFSNLGFERERERERERRERVK
jgi:hypothetical protein